jgi:hypothetical protein
MTPPVPTRDHPPFAAILHSAKACTGAARSVQDRGITHPAPNPPQDHKAAQQRRNMKAFQNLPAYLAVMELESLR